MFKASMEALWNSLIDPQLEPNGLIITLGLLMQLFSAVLEKFQPFDVMGLILRVTTMNLSWEGADEESRQFAENHLRNTVYLSTALMNCIPKEDLINRIHVSGTLREWRKYLLHFGSQFLFDSPTQDVRHLIGFVILNNLASIPKHL
ncbi:unnamed protein product [Rhizoctonia solani]|uniref:Uncharacterized protein n=1 Tax=Rhizoctonia solani TaxID=456999 RepID=A0A8H3BYG6_9AGAM|nr:unnamed protein product [Rhizoctonia solani]